MCEGGNELARGINAWLEGFVQQCVRKDWCDGIYAREGGGLIDGMRALADVAADAGAGCGGGQAMRVGQQHAAVGGRCEWRFCTGPTSRQWPPHIWLNGITAPVVHHHQQTTCTGSAYICSGMHVQARVHWPMLLGRETCMPPATPGHRLLGTR